MVSTDDLIGREAYSESVYLDVVSPDGQSAFIARLSRYPDHGIAWLWANLFRDGRTYASYDHAVPCGPARVEPAEGHVRYHPVDERRALLARTGRPDAMLGASLRLATGAHESPEAPLDTDGPHALAATGGFEPLHPPHASMRGRIEVLGDARVLGEVGGAPFDVAGFGHWHEQHQEAPRFMQPFTYLTLRGDGLFTVVTSGPRRAAGFVVRDGETAGVESLQIDGRAPRRRLAVTLAAGDRLEGEAETVYDYSVPLFADWRRPGTVVRAMLGGVPVTGCINDWPGPPGAATGPGGAG